MSIPKNYIYKRKGKSDYKLLQEAHKLLDDLLTAIDEDREQRRAGNNSLESGSLIKVYEKAEEWVNDHKFE